MIQANPILEQKYMMLVGAYLDGWKQTSKGVWNFRCPFCGDSKTNKYKKRGYIIQERDMTYHFFCHNCGESKSLISFLYEFAPTLYSEYRKELFFSSKKSNLEESVNEDLIKQSQTSISDFIDTNKIPELISCDKLSKDHSCIKYLESRMIPESEYKRVFWTDNFEAIAKSDLFGEKYENTDFPKSGIVFELTNHNGSVVGYQLRDIDPECPKNRRFMKCTQELETGFFDIKSIDVSKPHFVFEGCFDALSVPNSVAALTSNLLRVNLSSAIYVNDNEPRNIEIQKQVKKIIDKGYKIVLISSHEFEGMDANELLKYFKGNSNDLTKFLISNTVSGLAAKIAFAKWKK